MGRRVMDSEAIPDFGGHFRAKGIHKRLAAMDVQVVDYQMDRLRFRVCHRQRNRYLSELEP